MKILSLFNRPIIPVFTTKIAVTKFGQMLNTNN